MRINYFLFISLFLFNCTSTKYLVSNKIDFLKNSKIEKTCKKQLKFVFYWYLRGPKVSLNYDLQQ